MSARTTAKPMAGPMASFAMPPVSAVVAGLIGSTLLALAVLLATTQLGSGDYGQWLMAARPYAGLELPPYRADAAVPPVVPLLLGAVQRVIGDPVASLHVVALFLLVALGVTAFTAGWALFGRLAGALAMAGALLFSDLFLQLFAFGGLLQGGAIAFLWLSIGLAWLATRNEERAARRLALAAVAIGLGALTHTGTAAIAVPTGIAASVLAALVVTRSWRGRARALLPLVAVLAIAGVYWLALLMPGATDLARNPASLDYRGPNRLVQALTSSWPNVAILLHGGASVLGGAVADLRARRIGPWVVMAAWMAITAGVLGVAVAGGAATDYPRFVTPIMAPLVVAAAGGASILLQAFGGWASGWLRSGSPAGWSVAVVALLVAAAIPAAVGEFAQEARGYEVSDPSGLAESAAWIRANVAADGVVLAPAREGKWIEGLSGRGALFSNAVRYSFREDEWQRSFAADALLQGAGGALLNEFFLAKLSDGGASDGLPRGVVIAANHGGEFVDLLRSVPSATWVSDQSGTRMATLSNLAVETQALAAEGDDVLSRSVWSGDRGGSTVTLHQTVSLHRSSSTLELALAVPDSVASGSLDLTLIPGGGTQLDGVQTLGNEANLTYRPLGSQAPRLRIVASGVDASISTADDGTLVAHADGRTLRVLVTDLTAAPFPSAGLQVLEPETVLDRYHVQAALLRRDPSLAARERRLEALGFTPAATLGTYELLRRAPGP